MRRPFYLKSRKAWFVKAQGHDGRPTQIYLGKSRRAADREWHRLQTQGSDSTQVGEVLTLFLEWAVGEVARGKIEPGTLVGWRYYIKQWVEDNPDAMVDQLRPLDVLAWMDKRRGWNTSNRRHAAGALRRALAWAVQNGAIKASPLAGMRLDAAPAREFLISRGLHSQLVMGAVKTSSRSSARARSRRCSLRCGTPVADLAN